ncbi:MAG: protein kinase [Desulfovibrio sp.]|nr:protein kinase [Desulfovibrio sp.]
MHASNEISSSTALQGGPATGQGSAVPLPAGAQLGAYVVQRVLGKGAFGITYLAQDATLRTDVAIKEYFPQDFARRDAQGAIQPATPELRDVFLAGREAFLEEARILARFKHPNIVRILSFFEAGNTACMVMDYERGHSLKHLLKRRGTLSSDEVTTLLAPLLDGLERLHAQDFIHRDIKPGNIYVRQNGEPVLLDFGAACGRFGMSGTPGHSGGQGSQGSQVTNGYAPPEQYREDLRAQGPWTDCYALAAVALRCVTGVLPPDAPARLRALGAQEEDPLLPLLRQAQAVVSPPLLAVMEQGLALDAAHRLRSVRDWRDVWRQVEERVCLAAAASMDHMATSHPVSPPETPRVVLLVTAIAEHGVEDVDALRQLLPAAPAVISTGEEALRRLVRETLHACVVDSLLEDMSGLELLRRLRGTAGVRHTPLCFAGVELSRDQQLDAISLGACATFARPGTPETMAAVLRQMDALRQCHAREVALVAQARQALRQEDPAAALQCLENWSPLLPLSGSATGPATPGASRLRGAALQYFSNGCKDVVLGRLDDAGLAWAMSRKVATLEAEVCMVMAEAHRMAGRLQVFAEVAQQAHRAHQLMERMDLVATTLVETVSYDEFRPLPLNTVGVQLRRTGELAAAELAYAVALELSPFDPRVHYNMAKALAHRSKHKEAFGEICRALQLDPDFEEAELLYRKITGKAWHAGGARNPPRSLHGLYQPLLDV